MGKTLLHGISKVLIAKKTGNTYATPIVIDGVNVDETGIAQLVLNLTQARTKVSSGLKANALELNAAQTGEGTITFNNISRAVRSEIQDLVAHSNGGVSSGSLFKKRSRFGLTVIQEDADLTAGTVYYDIGFSIQASDTFNSISSDAPEATPLVLAIDAESIIVRKADGKIQDFFSTDFNSIDDADYIANLTSKIVVPEAEETEL